MPIIPIQTIKSPMLNAKVNSFSFKREAVIEELNKIYYKIQTSIDLLKEREYNEGDITIYYKYNKSEKILYIDDLKITDLFEI
jgi:hypothetical protein